MKSVLSTSARLKSMLGDIYRWVIELFRIPLDYLYDLQKFARFSGTFRPARSKQTLQAIIIRLYHGIEVGLTYQNPRPGFGIKTVYRLHRALRTYVKKYGFDTYSKIALNVLFHYHEFNRVHGKENQALFQAIVRLKDQVPEALREESRGGFFAIQRDQIQADADADFLKFVNARHSIRQYDASPVAMELLEKAISMAIQSPSACNRQGIRVYVLDDKKVRDRVLNVQNGNRGWRDQPDKVLLVTANVEYYKEARERNGVYVDGGLFAMSLVYGLHSLGLGTCCLNLNLDWQGVCKIRKAVGLRAGEVVIMLISVGHLPERLLVASSTRREVAEVLKVI